MVSVQESKWWPQRFLQRHSSPLEFVLNVFRLITVHFIRSAIVMRFASLIIHPAYVDDGTKHQGATDAL
jgi:hypothetical protein